MRFRIFHQYALGVTVLALLGCLATSAAAQRQARQAPPEPQNATVTLQQGGNVQFCDEQARCRQNRHPLAAGKVREIVAGDFVNGAAASWIALGDAAVHLCYMSGASGAITCAPIANGPDFAKFTKIAYLSLEDGSHTLKFTARNGNSAGREANYNPYPFMAGLSSATELLQQHVAQSLAGKGNLSNPRAAGEAGADLCAIGDHGGITCTGNDSMVAAAEVERNYAPSERGTEQLSAQQDEPNRITTVETGNEEAPEEQLCTSTMNTQMQTCNNPRANLSDRSRRACMGAARSNFQGCMARFHAGAD